MKYSVNSTLKLQMFLFQMRRALHCQGKFRILSNIFDGVFFENSQRLKAGDDFRNIIRNTSLHCICQGTLPHVSYSGCLWTLVSLLENSPVFFNMRISMWSVWNSYWFIFKKKLLKQRTEKYDLCKESSPNFISNINPSRPLHFQKLY